MSVIITPIEEKYADGYHACLDSVAREKKYLGFQEAPPIESTRSFVKENIDTNQPQFVALDKDLVVGWCDVSRGKIPTFFHTGNLGMGIYRQYRGQGIGRRLMEATIEKAFSIGIERIELMVYETNINAYELYKKIGFKEEGRMVRKVKIDSLYQDLFFMALIKDS